jgi:hypothetical protein
VPGGMGTPSADRPAPAAEPEPAPVAPGPAPDSTPTTPTGPTGPTGDVPAPAGETPASADAPATRRTRKGKPVMPSWDEVLLGVRGPR